MGKNKMKQSEDCFKNITHRSGIFPQLNESLRKSFRGKAPFVNTSTMQM